jgi:hypothetical protein
VAVFPIHRGPDGEVVPHDHPDLSNGNRLIRRVSNEYVVPDGNGGRRLSSAVFKHDPRQGHLSVDSEKCITDLPEEPIAYVTSPVWIGALILTVDQFRSVNKPQKPAEQWKIGMVPVPGNDCHAGVWGKITQGKSNDLQRLSQWLVAIPGVEKLTP